jgi:hypothetical protein
MARFILSHLSPWPKLNLVKKASANDINELLKHHAATSLNGILEYT